MSRHLDSSNGQMKTLKSTATLLNGGTKKDDKRPEAMRRPQRAKLRRELRRVGGDVDLSVRLCGLML